MKILDEPRYGDGWSALLRQFLTMQTADTDGEVHNLHGTCRRRPHVDLITMCGIRVLEEWTPFDGGPTTCTRCGLLAAFDPWDMRS